LIYKTFSDYLVAGASFLAEPLSLFYGDSAAFLSSVLATVEVDFFSITVTVFVVSIFVAVLPSVEIIDFLSSFLTIDFFSSALG
jgi:hypothetical protein